VLKIVYLIVSSYLNHVYFGIIIFTAAVVIIFADFG
jgi:hypothetical protein